MTALMLAVSCTRATGGGAMSVTATVAHPTPAWRRPGDLSLRVDGEALLLRHSDSPVVYRQDRQAGTFTSTDLARWSAARGPILECASAGRPDPEAWRIDATGRLLRRNVVHPLASPRALLVRLSPTGRWLAALSAAGKAGDSPLPALGSAPVTGPLRHQVLAAGDGALEGAALSLPREFERALVLSCWAPDERQVVYHDHFFTHVSMVPFASRKKEQP